MFVNFIFSILSTPLIFIAIGTGLIIASLQQIKRSKRAQRWVEVPATIVNVQAEERPVRRPTSHPQLRNRKLYQLDVSYEYVVGSKSYHANQHFWGDTGVDSLQEVVERRQKYRIGQRLNACYNPRKPQESVLERTLHKHTYSLLGLGSVVLVIGLLFCGLVLPSALKTCGVTPFSTQVRAGAPPWCERAMHGSFF